MVADMSKINSHLLSQPEALKRMQDEQDSYYPDFNQWVVELEKDPDYLEKAEKRLDDELGNDRLF